MPTRTTTVTTRTATVTATARLLRAKLRAKAGKKPAATRGWPSETNTRRFRAAWSGGMLVSVLFHALVFLGWAAVTIHPMSAAGSGTDTASEKREAVRLVRLPAPTPRPAPSATPQPSAPHFTRQVPTVAVREMASRHTALDLTPASPLHGGVGTALEIPEGASRPIGGGLESAESRYVDPVARNILPDWKPSGSLHGVVVTARAHVDAAGRPTGLVELVPPTGNQRVNRQIVSRVRTLEYQPARRGGEAVAAWAEITFVFCGMNVTATSPAPPEVSADPCEAGVAGEEASKELGH